MNLAPQPLLCTSLSPQLRDPPGVGLSFSYCSLDRVSDTITGSPDVSLSAPGPQYFTACGSASVNSLVIDCQWEKLLWQAVLHGCKCCLVWLSLPQASRSHRSSALGSLPSSQGTKYCPHSISYGERVPILPTSALSAFMSPSLSTVRSLSHTHSAGSCHSLHIGSFLQLLLDKLLFPVAGPALWWLSRAVIWP